MFKALYLPLWFSRAKFFGRRAPLQSVIFITNKCNLTCKHCVVYRKDSTTKSYEEIKKDFEYSYSLGSRFIDLEGGEPTLWRDGERDINSLIELAKRIGFFSVTVTTNAQLAFTGLLADSIWVSLDGLGGYYDEIRGKGAFARLLKNVETANHKALNANMVVNSVNYHSVEETIKFVKASPHFKLISINFHTPYEGTEHLFLDWDKRRAVIEKVVAMKKAGYPIMNSVSGLVRMKDNNFKKSCWVTNYVLITGERLSECKGSSVGVCDRCGYSMAGEMAGVLSLSPDTVAAGLKLRMGL